MRTLRVVFALIVALFVFSCAKQESPDRGYDLSMRVQGAQLMRSAFPASAGGPSITVVDLRDTRVSAGEADNAIQGRASAGTFAINVGFEGEAAYWSVPVLLADEVNMGELQFKAIIDYARRLPPGPFQLLFQAVDGAGKAGEIRKAALEIVDPLPSAILRFQLEWDAQVDADLVVQDPNGIIIDAKNIASTVPPKVGSGSVPEDNWKNGGVLDVDSNANCVIDGLRRETIYWQREPPKGVYRVYAALSSSCGLTHSAFRVVATYRGQSRAYTDVLYASDGRSQPLAPSASPGLLVAEFNVP
jgi:hypothetical protein